MGQAKIILMAGGASGIGRAIADHLAAEGHKVVNADLSHPQSRPDWSAKAGVIDMQLDVTNDASIERLVRSITENLGRLDALVYAAAPSRAARKPFPENLAMFRKEIDILLTAALEMSAAALPLLREGQDPSIVFVGSVLSRRIAQETIGYHTAKAGLAHAARYLAMHLAPQGVRVNVISPGVIKRDPLLGMAQPAHNPHFEMQLRSAVPTGRAGTSLEIAELVAFLLSGKAAYITGQDIVVDGGLILQEPFNLLRKSKG